MHTSSISHYLSRNVTGILPKFDILHNLVFVFITIFAIVSLLSNVDPLFAQTSTANDSEQVSTTTTNEIKSFKDSKTKVSFQYPSDWEVASDEYVKSNYGSTEGVIALLLPKSLDGATMSIFYEDLPFSMSANEYAKASKKALLENEDTSVSDSIPISIGNLDGYKYNATLSDDTISTGDFVQTHIVFVKNSKGFLIAYNPGATDIAQDIEDIESMIESFEMNNSNKEKTENDVSLQSSNDKEFAIAKDKARDIMTYVFSSIFPETGEKYSNTNYGVDIAFPKNWTGFEMKVIFPMAVVSPEGFNITDIFSSVIDASVDNIAEKIVSDGISDLPEQKKQELTESISNKLMEYTENRTATMGVFIYDKEFTRLMKSLDTNNTIPADSLTSSYELFGTSDPTISCERKTLEYITLKNNISAERSTEQCTYTASNKNQNNLNYFVLAPNAIVHIQYAYDTNKQDDKFLPEFEEALKSLSVKETLPINNQTIQQFLSD